MGGVLCQRQWPDAGLPGHRATRRAVHHRERLRSTEKIHKRESGFEGQGGETEEGVGFTPVHGLLPDSQPHAERGLPEEPATTTPGITSDCARGGHDLQAGCSQRWRHLLRVAYRVARLEHSRAGRVVSFLSTVGHTLVQDLHLRLSSLRHEERQGRIPRQALDGCDDGP